MTETTWQPIMVRLADLTPWERNPKRISKAHASRLLDLWQRLGQFQTIAIGPAGEVYDGHQRLSVLKAAHGNSYEVQALQSSRALTEQEREELTIAAHSGTTGTWDWDALSGWDADNLQQWGFDGETLTNWQADIGALSVMLASEEEPPPDDPGAQIDKAEELQAKWGTATGQLWQLGEHRLICGDCTDREVVASLMDGERARMLFTSPPYADMREYGGNDLSLETLVQIFPVWHENTEYFVVNLGLQFKDEEVYDYWCHWIDAAKRQGLKMLAWNVWDKVNATSVSSQIKMFALTHEWIFVFGKQPVQLNRTWEKSEESKKREKYYQVNSSGQKVTTRRQADGSVRPSTIGNIYANKNMGSVYTGYAEMGRNIDHPARFPVEFPSAYIEAMSNKHSIVAEPFLGSGTTLIACERLGRRCRACEISPAYCAVTIERWHVMTGGEPVLIG